MEITFKLGRRQKTYQKMKRRVRILVLSAMTNLKQGEWPKEQQGGAGCCFTQEGLSERCFQKSPEGSEGHIWKYLEEEYSRQ